MLDIFTALACLFVTSTAEYNQWLTDDIINNINSKQNLWKAGRNFPRETSMSHFEKLMGVRWDTHFSELQKMEYDTELISSLPENFDPRDKWPNCPTLNDIRDQGSCRSCWAFGAVEAMTDRFCTYSNGSQHFYFSALDLLSCCYYCGLGCNGGLPSVAWEYWKHTRLVSGGSYNSSQGCRPYEIPPCKRTDDRMLCDPVDKTPVCHKKCEDSYKVNYPEEKRFGKHIYAVFDNEDHIKAELYKNGPIEATFIVYADFLNYKSGVYKHTAGDLLGVHAVKILGWGVENGNKYWFAANSWNSDWGDNGFFKILRGENHCRIESYITAGEPLLI